MAINPNKILDKILSRDLSLLLYKIFNDTLFLLLIAFGFFLLAEGLIPGFASSHLSFTKIVLVIFANLGMVIYLGKRNDISFNPSGIKKNKLWLAFFLIFFVFLLIRALYKFSVWEIIVIVISSLVIFYFFYKNTLKKE